LKDSRKADVVVIGGGYTGLSAALHLAAAGSEVVLLEAREPGFGASGRNHGQVVPILGAYGPDDLVAKLGPDLGERMNAWIAGSADLVFDLIRQHEIECDGRQTGWMLPVESPARNDMVRARTDAWAKREVPVKWLDAKAAADAIGSEVYYGALLHERGGNIQPLSYARGLARAVLAAGAAIHAATPVTKLSRQSGGWRVETAGATIEADAVVLATNAYSTGLWPGVKESVVPFRIFLGATKPLSENVAKSILPGRQSLSDSRNILWPFRLDRDSRLITGGDHIVTVNSRAKSERSMKRRVAHTFPQVGEVEVDYIWDGKVGITLDRLPRYLEPAPGLFAGLGYSGRGIALATAMGKLLAERVLGEGEAALPLPKSKPQWMPFHELSMPIGRLALLPYKWRDRQAAKSRRQA
jgi:glycine/D-amino acid oxidase-like deaminating enzyme